MGVDDGDPVRALDTIACTGHITYRLSEKAARGESLTLVTSIAPLTYLLMHAKCLRVNLNLMDLIWP